MWRKYRSKSQFGIITTCGGTSALQIPLCIAGMWLTLQGISTKNPVWDTIEGECSSYFKQNQSHPLALGFHPLPRRTPTWLGQDKECWLVHPQLFFLLWLAAIKHILKVYAPQVWMMSGFLSVHYFASDLISPGQNFCVSSFFLPYLFCVILSSSH